MSNLLLTSPFDFSAIFGSFTKYWYFYLALFLIVAGLTVFFILVKPVKRARLNSTQRLVYISMLTAICTVANAHLTILVTRGNSLSFTITVCFLAGYLLGARAGFAVGFIGDLIGCIIFPQGVYLPLMSIASGLYGFIPGLLFSYFDSNKKLNNFVKTVISAFIIYAVCSLALNSVSLWLVYSSKSFGAYLLTRLPIMSLNAVVNCALCFIIVGILPRILPKNKFVFDMEKKDENNFKS